MPLLPLPSPHGTAGSPGAGLHHPSCPWCRRVKAYLRERQVHFREVDVSRDAAAARDLVCRTGQMGVPVIQIDGRPIVGFDRPQIDRLLGFRR